MKKYFFTLLLAFISATTFADTTLPGKCLVGLPKILSSELISEQDIKNFQNSGDWGQSNRTDRFWVVWSDRENNTTYNGPSHSSGRFATLSFNQEVRIAKIENGFALVYEEQMTNAANLKINKGVTKGWVPMNHLLLWSSCPVNEKGIYNKAIPLVNADEYDKVRKSGKKPDLGRIYKNPELKSGAEKFKTGIDFYFVMKTDKASGLVLLGKEANLSGGYSSKVLYGWVSTESYFKWNQRACIEPTWNREAAAKLEGKNANVYRDLNFTEKACELILGRQNTLSNGHKTYRMNPYEMRYPLLGNEDARGAYRVTAFGTGSDRPVIYDDRENPAVKEIQEKKLKEVGTVNLIVVIDGTSSMKSFYNPTQQIIKRANDYFSQQKGNIVKVGVVIYRDHPDKGFCTEYIPMTSPSSPELEKFLSTGGKYGIKSVATSATEALYTGLELALDHNKMGYSPRNSNLMFVIGDCGNDPEDHQCPSEETIIKKCADNGIQLSAFQVYNGTSQPYKLFRSQMGKIIRESLKLQYGGGKVSGLQMGWNELVDGYEFKTNLNSDAMFYIGNIRNAPNGQTMEVAKLYDLVKDSYIQFNTAVDVRKAAIINGDEITIDNDDQGSASAKVMDEFLKKMYDPKDLKMIRDRNALMAFEGYAAKVDKETGHDYWKEVIYISRPEFDGLMRKLQPVVAAAEQGTENREPYISAMKKLIQIMIPDITEGQMNSMSTAEIMRIAAGLPAKADATSKSIKDLGDKEKVTQEVFDELVAQFKVKYRKLDRIKDNPYDFTMKRNGTDWFWIPIEDLP